MKRIFYTLIVLLAVALVSCKKNNNELTIKQYDDNQIQTYIQQNGLTAMKRDTSGGDTTGIYYQILNVGTGPVVDYPSLVSYVTSYHTFDNEYSSLDTMTNHTYTFLGHVSPNALQLSIKNIMKTKGTKVRLLIPSRLAFGKDGYFAGSIHINGNECLDYTVNLLDDEYDQVKQINYQNRYDDLSIKNYMAAYGLTSSYTKLNDSKGNFTGLYYKITQTGTGTSVISNNSTVGLQYSGFLLDGNTFEIVNNADQTVAATTFTMYDAPNQAFQLALPLIHEGSIINIIAPSYLGFGQSGSTNSLTGVTVPAFSCLQYNILVVSVTN